MGNYLTTFYKDSVSGGYVPENNNCTILAAPLPCESRRSIIKPSRNIPKVSSGFTVVEVSALVSMNSMPREYEDNSFLLKRFWDKLISFPYVFKTAANLSKSSERNLEGRQETYQIGFDTPAEVRIDSLRSCNETLSSNFKSPNYILDCEQYRCFCARKRIDLDNFYLTALLDMGKTRQLFNQPRKVCGSSKDVVQSRPGLSFFVELREPYKRYPLDDKYKFSSCHDCCSLASEDTLYSDECSEDDVLVSDEDFIVFEEREFHDDNYYGRHVFITQQSTQDSLICFKSESLDESCYNVNSTNYEMGIGSKNLVSEEREQKCETRATRVHQACETNKACKKVNFRDDEDLIVVYHMKHWDFAYRQARKGPWELAAADRCRFWRRIKDLESVISPCLQQKLQAMKDNLSNNIFS